MTEIDHKREDERKSSNEEENEDDEDETTTYKIHQFHTSQKTEVELTTSPSIHIKPECQHVDDGKYNKFVDTS